MDYFETYKKINKKNRFYFIHHKLYIINYCGRPVTGKSFRKETAQKHSTPCNKHAPAQHKPLPKPNPIQPINRNPHPE